MRGIKILVLTKNDLVSKYKNLSVNQSAIIVFIAKSNYSMRREYKKTYLKTQAGLINFMDIIVIIYSPIATRLNSETVSPLFTLSRYFATVIPVSFT